MRRVAHRLQIRRHVRLRAKNAVLVAYMTTIPPPAKPRNRIVRLTFRPVIVLQLLARLR